MSAERYYITTAISYPNGKPHIGHAYELIATDALARFQRLDGKQVYFLTGTDEHGIKMHQTARKEGVAPRELADRNAAEFQRMAEALNASNDDFIRTTEERHYRSCQAIWKAMDANGDIYKDSYAGWYSVRDEAYYGEEETELRDDGVRYGPQGTPVEWVEEESYFFRLSAYQDRLLKLYEERPEFVGPAERKEALARPDADQGLAVHAFRHREGYKFVINRALDARLDRQGAAPRPHRDIGRGQAGHDIARHPDRMLGPGLDHFVDIGAEGQDLPAAAVADEQLDGDERRILHLDAAALGRRDQPERPVRLARQHRGEQADELLPPDRALLVVPATVACDADRDVAAEYRRARRPAHRRRQREARDRRGGVALPFRRAARRSHPVRRRHTVSAPSPAQPPCSAGVTSA